MFIKILPNASNALPGEIQELSNLNLGNSRRGNDTFFTLTTRGEYGDEQTLYLTAEELRDVINKLTALHNSVLPKGHRDVIQARLF